MRPFLATVLVLLLGCHRSSRDVAPPSAADQREALAQLAARIDVGEHAGLASEVPDWLADELRVSDRPDVAAIAKRLEAEWTWQVGVANTTNTPSVLELLRAAASLERLIQRSRGTEALAAKFVLVEVYGRLDQPVLVDGDGDVAVRFRQTLEGPWMAPGIASRLDEAWPVIVLAIRGARDLQRHLLADLLRHADSDDPRLAAAMLVTAMHSDATMPEDVELAQHAVRLRGKAASLDEVIPAAHVCLRALDAGCAAEFVAQARRIADPKDASARDRIEDAEKRRRDVLRIDTLARYGGLEADLERAPLLALLWHGDDAFGIYAALVARYPDDARVIAGFAKMLAIQESDYAKALAKIDGAPARLQHIEPAYYELAIGLRCAAYKLAMMRDPSVETTKLAESVKQRVMADSRALAELGSDAGVVLTYLFDREPELDAAMEKDPEAYWSFSDRVLGDAMKMRERFPKSRHVHRLLVASSIFAQNRDLAGRALALPLPDADDEKLGQLHRNARFAVAITRNQPLPRAEIFTEIPNLGDTTKRALQRLRADVDAVEARRGGDVASWVRVGREYVALMRDNSMLDVRHAYGIAVAMHEAGEREAALDMLEDTLALANQDLSDDSEIGAQYATLDLVALGRRPRSELVPLADSFDPKMRALALALLISDSRGRERKSWQRKLAREHGAPCEELVQGIATSRYLILEIEWGHVAGLELRIEAEVVPWLLVEAAVAPLRDQICKGAARTSAGV